MLKISKQTTFKAIVNGKKLEMAYVSARKGTFTASLEKHPWIKNVPINCKPKPLLAKV
jgi:hypothetical protein